jgi:hypothetical protein
MSYRGVVTSAASSSPAPTFAGARRLLARLERAVATMFPED